uniref:Uncharacterized protein n=1 Tax=Anguilla anguilla TaxID=7936 RepID=A0A0E9PND1_ANGAN
MWYANGIVKDLDEIIFRFVNANLFSIQFYFHCTYKMFSSCIVNCTEIC